MNIHIVTLFPEFFDSSISCGLLGKAVESGLVKIHFHNPRDFTSNAYQSVDDRPYGGGPGMVMLLDPILKALESIRDTGKTLLMAAAGQTFNQKAAKELAKEENITIICGRYEGVDARLEEIVPLTPLSVGSYILNGGETAALSVIESVCRLLPGFMGDIESGTEESYSDGLLEYPHYTRPAISNEKSVPALLISGHHAEIEKWRRAHALATTWRWQPELLKNIFFTPFDLEILNQLPRKRPSRNLFIALVHYPVLDKDKKTVAVSLTNLDIHDIARCSCSYTLGGAFIVTPIKDQQKLLHEILKHWLTGAGSVTNPHRQAAMGKIFPAESVEDAIMRIEELTGMKPTLIASSAQGSGSISFSGVQKLLEEAPVLLLLGTGHGLAPEVINKCKALLQPLRFLDSYNHLSVRMAAAIMIDRIIGDFN